MVLPSTTEPRPGGKPAPSRVRMSIFQAAMSASLIGSPKPAEGRAGTGDVGGAAHPPTIATDTTSEATLCDRIAHLSVGTHRPGKDSVVMLDKARHGPGLHDLGDRGLHVAGRVHRAALNDSLSAIPGPAVAKTREALVEDRLFEGCGLPVPAAIIVDVHRRDLARPGPGETLDLVQARAFELHGAERSRDYRLALHHETERTPRALGQWVAVARCLASKIPGLTAHLDSAQPLD